jgi:HEAT repeat protein
MTRSSEMNPPKPADRAGRRWRRRWLLAAIVAALAVWLAVPREPRHDGLSLSEWVAAPAEAGRSPEEAAAALRSMEPRATATLLRWLQTRESRWRRRLCELAARQNWFTLEPDRAWERREWAVSGFALLGTNAAPAIPRLARLVDDPEIGPAALGALRGIGLPSAPVLLAALTNNNAEARNGIVQILANEPFIDLPQALPSLLRALDDPDYQVQLTALGALAHCGRQPQVVWPALAQRGRDTNFDGRAFALRALTDAQASADLAVPVFVAALADGNLESRRAAIAGLLRVEGDAALEPLLRALEDSDVAVRAKAAVGLGKFPQHIDRILPLLHARLTNDLPVVRGAAANGLSKFGPASRRVVPDLMALLRETSSQPLQLMMQSAARGALLKIDPEAAARAGIRPEEPPSAGRRGRRGASLDMPPLPDRP